MLIESISPVSQSARAALEDAVESFNRDVPSSKASELIDKRTEFATLSKYAQKELALRYGEDTVPQRKRDRLWRSTKRGMEKFSKTIYNYKGVMDVLVSAHPEIASLACMYSVYGLFRHANVRRGRYEVLVSGQR